MGSSVVAEFNRHLPVLMRKMVELEKAYCALIVDVLDQSVNNLLHNSVEILNEKDLSILQNFANLYRPEDLAMAGLTNSINDSVRNIVEQSRRQLVNNQEIKIEESAEQESQRMSLANYQKYLEMLQASDDSMRESVSSFVMDLQSHDLVRQMLQNLDRTFQGLEGIIAQNIELVRNGQVFEFGPYIQQMCREFTTVRERNVFSYHFYRLQGKGKRIPIHGAASISLMISFGDFFDQYIVFYKKVLLIADKHLEKTVRFIGERVNIILNDAGKVSSFSKGSYENLKKTRDMLASNVQSGFGYSGLLPDLAYNLQSIMSQDAQMANKLQPIIISLQFQDRVQQHFRNWVDILFFFQQTLFFTDPGEIKTIFDVAGKNFRPFGQVLFKKATMMSERKIILQVFDLVNG